MVWQYYKRAANGSEFVSFGMEPVISDALDTEVLVSYVCAVLDSLGILHGPKHAELTMTNTGPCLVEMYCRAPRSNAAWVAL